MKLSLSFLLLLFLVFCSCTNKKTGDADGLTGRHSAIVTFENARIRCGFQSQEKEQYTVQCQTAVVDASGNEILATEVAEGVNLRWDAPKVLTGSEVQDLSCTDDLLTQTCKLSLEEGLSSKIGFYLQVEKAGLSKTETDSVLLPYSVGTIGFIPQAPIQYAKLTTQLQDTASPVGFQSIELDPTQMKFSDLQAMCAVGEKIYFSTNSFIYILEKGKIKIYAGSMNPDDLNNLSGRLRLQFTSYITSFSCSANALYVKSPDSKYYRIQAEGPVQIVLDPKSTGETLNESSLMVKTKDGSTFTLGVQGTVNKKDSKGVNTVFASGLHLPQQIQMLEDGSLLVLELAPGFKGITRIDSNGGKTIVFNESFYKGFVEGALAQNTSFSEINSLSHDAAGNLYLLDNGQHSIFKIDTTGKVYRIATNLDKVDSIAVTSVGVLYLAESIHNRIRALSPSGMFSTVLENIFAVSLAVGADDSLFISAQLAHKVMKLNSAGVLSVVAGTGVQGYSGDNGPALGAKLSLPDSIAVSSDGSLVISDQHHSFYQVLRLVNSSGIITTIAGGGTVLTINTEAVSERPAKNYTLVGSAQITFGETGKIYATAGLGLYVLKLQADKSYSMQRLVGGKSEQDCGTGVIEKKVKGEDLEKNLQVTLSSLCTGNPVALSFQDSCSNGQASLYYSQFLNYNGATANIVKVSYPCH